MRNIVVVQWSRLGDLLQTRPLLNHIARHQPECRIVLCADARYGSIIAAMPESIDFWPVDLAGASAVSKHSSSHGEALRHLRAMCEDAEDSDTDAVYVLSKFFAATVFAEMLRPKRAFGFRRSGKTILSPYVMVCLEKEAHLENRLPVHLADIWTCLDGEPPEPSWPIPMRSVKPSNTERRVGLLCDAGEDYRSIPAKWLAQVARCLAEKHRILVTLYGAKRSEPEDDPRAFCTKDGLVSDERGKLSLQHYMLSLSAQDTVIGPDTGGLHLAAALGVNVIGLYFGGASCQSTGPYAANSVVIQDPKWNEETADLVIGLATSHTSPGGSQMMPHYTPQLDQHGLSYTGSNWSPNERQRVSAYRESLFADFQCSSERPEVMEEKIV